MGTLVARSLTGGRDDGGAPGGLDAAAFLLIKTGADAYRMVHAIRDEPGVRWASATYGPHQVVAYAAVPTRAELAGMVEAIRVRDDVAELDARLCKVIPGDEGLGRFGVTQAESAVLLINVDIREETERETTYRLRKVGGVQVARAMWGPADIVAVVEAPNHESLRNVICDDVKAMRGVSSNTTLYCYPPQSVDGRATTTRAKEAEAHPVSVRAADHLPPTH
jgi:hypothetical protein